MTTAKQTMSDAWFVRIDGSHDFLKTQLNGFKGKIDTKRIFGIYHTGDRNDNPHCHFVIQTTGQVQKQSFALRCKNTFNIEKRSQYSVNVWDGNIEAIAYMFHEEGASELVRMGFTDEEIKQAKAINESVQKVVNVNKQKASGKLVEKALEEFKDKDVVRYDVLIFMLKQIQEGNNYHPGEGRLKMFVEEVMVRRTSDLEGYAYELERRLWRD